MLGTIEEQSANVNNNPIESRIRRSSSVESLTDYEGELLRPELFHARFNRLAKTHVHIT